jgi:F-type H+-transporting ATPase subunit epsilon
MPRPFGLTVMAPDHALFEGEVQGLIAPGIEGYLGVLAGHAPMVTELGPGVLTVVEVNGERRHYAVSAGFLEVRREEVAVLADAAEAAGEIDVERARAAEGRARGRLRSGTSDIDATRAEAALRRALARLQAVRKSGTAG